MTVLRARKKPVVIEAMRHEDSYASVQAIWAWSGGMVNADESTDRKGTWFLRVRTLEGVMRAQPGDYVIKGVKGEFYPCKPDVFLATYEVLQ